MQEMSQDSTRVTGIKVGASVLIAAGVGLCLWQVFAELPAALEKITAIATVAIVIHAIEGLIAAVLTFNMTPSPMTLPARLKATVQAYVYVFFVGTVGLWEIKNLR